MSEKPLRDWNVVVTLLQRELRDAWKFLQPFGQLSKSDYFNVLLMKVDDTGQFLDNMANALQADRPLERVINRIMPASVCFDFQRPAEFEAKLVEAVAPWVAQLAKGTFHVRMHRRGFKGRLSSQNEEQFLDGVLMKKLSALGAATRIDFEDPDHIVDIETVGQRAGVALWTRDQATRYPFLKLD